MPLDTLGMSQALGGAEMFVNNMNQIGMQKKLNKQQLDFNDKDRANAFKYQMQLWDSTNFAAQRDQLLKAGMNPALMYGKGGASGSTQVAGGGGSAPDANSRAVNFQQMMQGTAQLELLQAQKDNIEADTKNKLADADKTAGVDTQEAYTRIADITQGIENKKAQENLLITQNRLAELELALNKETYEDRVDAIMWTTKTAMHHADIAFNEAYIKGKTREDVVREIHAMSIGAVLRNEFIKSQTRNTDKDTELKGAQINKVNSDIKVNEATIKKMYAEIDKWAQELAMGWNELSQKERQIKLNGIEVQMRVYHSGAWGKFITLPFDSKINLTRQIDQIIKTEPKDFKKFEKYESQESSIEEINILKKVLGL